ncbi:hypothetical protein [Acetobacter ascendens]|uniref:Uncharacterized protein n=1 Tax=Acetobacter ascendens TaxID=481146 RepID=A0A1Y0UW13_9PROT|nr:hypothetical protein [Acetobacter ascendens]ARW09975.1 hypothetical protein S101447_00873 [Acetobacter ascendens]
MNLRQKINAQATQKDAEEAFENSRPEREQAIRSQMDFLIKKIESFLTEYIREGHVKIDFSTSIYKMDGTEHTAMPSLIINFPKEELILVLDNEHGAASYRLSATLRHQPFTRNPRKVKFLFKNNSWLLNGKLVPSDGGYAFFQDNHNTVEITPDSLNCAIASILA